MTWDLVADIGGTNMRVAQVAGGEIIARRDFAMTPDRKVAETLRGVADDLQGQARAIVCAGAGPVIDRAIHLTNGGWRVSEAEIAQLTGTQTVKVINDFEAAAWSLARLDPDDVQPLGGSGPIQPGNRVAVGPGTGLGVGALLLSDGPARVVPGEGGHVALGPRSAAEIPVFERLAQIWPETRCGETLTFEAEAILSGVGLPVLYQACAGRAEVKARDIVAAAKDNDPKARQCLDIFSTQLGALCGNHAMTFMAKGGVVLVGGVAQSNPDLFGAAFWQAFTAGGRFSDLRKACGVYLMKASDFGLRGCVNALQSLPL